MSNKVINTIRFIVNFIVCTSLQCYNIESQIDMNLRNFCSRLFLSFSIV